jgi:hypothetical protein
MDALFRYDQDSPVAFALLIKLTFVNPVVRCMSAAGSRTACNVGLSASSGRSFRKPRFQGKGLVHPE